MRKIILMLSVILGITACDNGEYSNYSELNQFEDFRIGTGDYSVLIKDLLNMEDSSRHYENSLYIVICKISNKKFTITLEENYGCVEVMNCSIENVYVDYDEFKKTILRCYFN